MIENRNVSLAQSTTLRLGGNAARFVHAENENEVAAVVTEADARGEAVLLLGGGSNLVVGDGGFDGVVVKCAFDGIRVLEGSESTTANRKNFDDEKTGKI
ncbi:MAG: FAD-binding protein, partial [Polyangiaceae bacterium]